MFGRRHRRRSTALLGIAAAAALMAASLATAPAAPAASPTVVTLTFDDGVSDVYQAGPAMAARGMAGTFFINSGAVGDGTHLSRTQLDALAAAGNEIGGHTVLHADLAALSPDEARREVCMDRQTLLGWGFPVTSFAYPYSSVSPAVEGYARDCGYTSARQVGDIVSPGQCAGCDLAETIPPADPFYTRAPDSVLSSWTLADIQSLVTQARGTGSGWVQLVFHHICDGCDLYGVAPATFTALLDWLQGQVAAGQVVVRPVNQVVTGPVQPAIAGPAPPAPAPYGVNALTNPGLESSSNGQTADCWKDAGYGVNTVSSGLVADAHSGARASRVAISSWTSGDRKLVPALDLGQCSPSASPGHVYRMSAWYRSTLPVPVVAYYRRGGLTWTYWTGSGAFPASAGWAQAVWTTPPLPAGADAVSFGLALTGVGTLSTDDYSLVDLRPDTTAPTAALTAPANGSTVSDTVLLAATAEDDVGVTRVDFLVDGRVVGSDSSAPYQVPWSSAAVPNGQHAISAVGYDAAGNASTPAPVTVTTQNAAVNLLQNPGLESGTGAVPDCWQAGSSGSSTGSVLGGTVARSGTRGATTTITSWTSGDRKLVVRQDAGTCSPAAVPGHTYQVGTWFRSTAPTAFVLYYRNASGSWVYWRTGPVVPVAGSWTQASWTTPALPAGATALSFGLALGQVGTVSTDDYTLADLG